MFLERAYNIAGQSPDKSTQNGAVLVRDNRIIGEAFNSPPHNIFPVQDRPEKYWVFEHAERALLYNFDIEDDDIIYCPWAACCDCARAILFCRITKLVVHWERMQLTHGDWKDNVDYALNMLIKGGVEILYYHGPIPGAESILVNGKLWSPDRLEYVDESIK